MCDDLRSLCPIDDSGLLAIRGHRRNHVCRIYVNEVMAIYVFSSPITATAKATAHGLVAAFVLLTPPPHPMGQCCVFISEV